MYKFVNKDECGAEYYKSIDAFNISLNDDNFANRPRLYINIFFNGGRDWATIQKEYSTQKEANEVFTRLKQTYETTFGADEKEIIIMEY